MSFDEATIERRLLGDEVLGFNLTGHVLALHLTVAPREFGYIMIRRFYVSQVTPFDPEAERELYLQWLEAINERQTKPYHVHVAVVREMPKEKESYPDDFPDNDDYISKENYSAGSIAEIEETVNRYGKSLADAKPTRELRLP